MLEFGGNDYLDLTRDPRVIAAVGQALEVGGVSSCASRVSVGTVPVHRELEEHLTSFLGVEDVAVLSSGYLAVLAALDALPPASSPGPPGWLHPHSHPALGAAARASGRATTSELPVPDSSTPHSLAFLASDACDGFSGRLFPLDELLEEARRRGAPLVIDDAHGVGVLGEGGRGTLSHFGLADPGIVLAGSLGKALGSAGGFVAGSREAIERLRSGSTYTGSTALSPLLARGALTALEILVAEPGRATRLVEGGRWLEAELVREGLPVVGGDEPALSFPAVITLDLGDPQRAANLAGELEQHGIRVAHFTYAASASSARLRIPLSSRHSREDLERLLEALLEVTAARAIDPDTTTAG